MLYISLRAWSRWPKGLADGETPAPVPPGDGAVEPDALLATKLHIPQTRRNLLAHPRLAERLAEGLQA